MADDGEKQSMKCPFYHILCGKCGKNVCRAYFPEKQPYVTKTMERVCTSDDYAAECLVYAEAVKWREARKEKKLGEQCPFARNTTCGKPWLWVCNGGVPPFDLTEVKTDERGIPIRDKETRDVVFLPGKSIDDLKDVCLSGVKEVYEACPNYKEGMAFRELVKRVKKGGKI